jgi:hypothetical protein
VVVCAVLVGTWVGSRWFSFGWMGSSRTVCIYVRWGKIGFTKIPPPGWIESRDGWHLVRTPAAFEWSFEWFFFQGFRHVRVPLYAIALPPALASTAAWRLDTRARRRARVGHCPACNYDRRGIPAASVCPECGAPPTAISASPDG